MPIRANTEGAAALISDWMVKGIGALGRNLKLANLIQRDSGPNPERPLNTLNVTVRGALTARSKAEGNDIVSDAPTNTNVDVVLSYHDYVSWEYEDSAAAKMNPTGFNYYEDALIALGEKIETRCAALYAGLTTQIGAAATPITEAAILEAKARLSALGVPEMGRFAFLDETEENRLITMDRLSRADARGNAGQVITEGKVGRLYGIDIHPSNLVSKTTGPPLQTHNIVGHPMFGLMVMRPLELPKNGSGAAGLYIQDPKTGLAYRYVYGYDIRAQTTVHTVDVLYGLKVIDPRLALELRT